MVGDGHWLVMRYYLASRCYFDRCVAFWDRPFVYLE